MDRRLVRLPARPELPGRRCTFQKHEGPQVRRCGFQGGHHCPRTVPEPRHQRSGFGGRCEQGGQFVVFEPVFRDYRAWRATWTKLVWRKASDWSWLLEHDPRIQLVAHIRSDEIALKKNYFKPLQAFVYRRKR